MDELKQKAIGLGMCKEFRESWNDDLVGMYKRSASWCLMHKFPSLKDMIQYDNLLVDNDVHNSKCVDLILTGNAYIINDCTGNVEICDYNVSRLYTALNTSVEINVKDNSILIIEAYDNSIIRISVEENALCTIWAYGNAAVQVLSGNVKMTRK